MPQSSTHAAVVTAEGHLVDSQLLKSIFDRVIERGGDFEVQRFELGRTNDDFSRLTLKVTTPDEASLARLLEDLIPFGCLSEAEAHTIHYPNGDVTHCFALCFLARSWRGEPTPDQEESTEARFADLGAPPEPLHRPTAHALDLLAAYLRSGSFQVR